MDDDIFRSLFGTGKPIVFKKYNAAELPREEKPKPPELNWYQEPKYFVMEISKDRSWINKPFYKEFREIETFNGRKSPSLTAIMLGYSNLMYNEPEKPVTLAFAYKDGELYIEEEEFGIEIEYISGLNKAILNQSKMIDFLHYMEYSVCGIWLFDKLDGGLYKGTKVMARAEV